MADFNATESKTLHRSKKVCEKIDVWAYGLRDISCKKNKINEDTSLVEKGM